MSEPLVPRPGVSLADIIPAWATQLGLEQVAQTKGDVSPIAVPESDRLCLLVVDGLGWNLLRTHAGDAPFLYSLTEGTQPLTAGFPATTASSIAAIGTGSHSGQHGVVGLSFRVASETLLNVLGWNVHGPGMSVDLLDVEVPEKVQPASTMFEKLAAAGVEVHTVVPGKHISSGLTRAALRGGRLHGTAAVGDLASKVIESLTSPGPTLCYAYHGDLDMMGHLYGPGSLPWRLELAQVDHLARCLTELLPPGSSLAITGDHGMVSAAAEHRLDIDSDPDLLAGVALIGGEPRVRHVYADGGAVPSVLAAWTSTLGDRAWVLSKQQALDEGWFGPVVTEDTLPRIGDVVAAARDTFTLVRSQAEPLLTHLPGQHGSLTEDEQLVPLLTIAGC